MLPPMLRIDSCSGAQSVRPTCKKRPPGNKVCRGPGLADRLLGGKEAAGTVADYPRLAVTICTLTNITGFYPTRFPACASAQSGVGLLRILRFVTLDDIRGAFWGLATRRTRRVQGAATRKLTGALIMGKYLLGWILGVPMIVLVVIYLLFN
jgi:hypothetical protein